MARSGGTAAPSVKPERIHRPRVSALLEEGMAYPAVVVAAGAGFGKTQAVASFLETSPYHGVWLQLTELDNLPLRFWESFTYTCALHRPALGEKLKRLGFPDTLYQFHKFLQFFTEELYTDDRFVVMVFDDVQTLRDETVRQFFTRLVAATLENICMVFISRDINSYSYHRSVYVVTTDDLRFTWDEAACYFETLGIELGADELERIHAYTGGWPMALYLVGLQLRRRSLSGEEVMTQSKQLIFQLIEKEMFSTYDTAVQRFLIRLSVLNAFPRGLIEYTAGDAAGDVLHALNNNVLVSYDAKAQSYYFHQVFLDYLKGQQGVGAQEELRHMLLQAAAWCAQNGHAVDAMDYYDRSGEYAEVWAMIAAQEGVRRPQAEAAVLLRYIETFPPAFIEKTPMCRIVYAMLLLNNLQTDRALEEMHAVYAQLEGTAGTDALRGEACAAYGLISLGLENLDFVEWFKKAAALLPAGSGRWRASLHLVEYSSALNLSSPAPGELKKSVGGFFEGMPYVSRVLHGAGHGLEYLAAAEAEFLTGDMRMAQTQAHKAYDMAAEKEQTDIMDGALFLLLRAALVNGNDAAIEETLQRLRGGGATSMRPECDIALGWYYSELSNVPAVAAWILYDAGGGRPPISVDRDALVRVRCLIEEQKYIEALADLERLESLYRRRNSLISLIYAQVYRAIACYQLDDGVAVISALEEAYALAHGNGLIMPFIEYGHRTRALLGYAREHARQIPDAWLEVVHTKAATYAKRHAYLVSKLGRGDGAQAPPFSLTKRENELIKNLSQGLTREEIASAMYVSPHTVKSMLKNVYNKIGAVNGADAVRITMGAGLL